jgi:ABC-2 type transport system permease protein
MNHASVSTWSTLIKREWLQHRIGWLTVLFGPPLLFMLGAIWGDIQFDADDTSALKELAARWPQEYLPWIIALASTMAAVYFALVAQVITALLMAAGLTHKDHEDRSHEFWLSLPTSHNISVAATLVAHAVVLPVLALLAALALGLVSGLAVFWRIGDSATIDVSTLGAVGATLSHLALRIIAGLPAALFWLAPIYLALVAAGAWFKRWGLPLLVVGAVILHLLLSRLLNINMIATTLEGLAHNWFCALFIFECVPEKNPIANVSPEALWPTGLWKSWASAMTDLATPLALFALMFSAMMFALLVWRRRTIV